MPTESEIYQAHADQYERLIQREDYCGNILREIKKVICLEGLEVVDLGAGTGRLTRLLAPHVRSILAFDSSVHMLETARKSLRTLRSFNWRMGVADHRHIPVADASADLVISGWSFCYLAVWGGANWQSDLQAGLDEINRILRPGGTIILLETLGTGSETPTPPEHLGGYYAWLTEAGFGRGWMRTDYRFDSLAEAVELSTFFFGEEMGQRLLGKKDTILPECTGIWHRKRV